METKELRHTGGIEFLIASKCKDSVYKIVS